MERQMGMEIERRCVELKELRVVDPVSENDTGQQIIEGHASVFDSWSQELGGEFPFREKVMKGAFIDSIQNDDIRALFNHDPNYILGRNKAGTLTLEEDEKGLKVRIVLPETQYARDLLVSIKRGDITQMSFGFCVIIDKWDVSDGLDIRELHKVKLYDVSPVTFPAYEQTDIGVRSADAIHKRHLEDARKSKENERKQAEMQLLKQKIKFI